MFCKNCGTEIKSGASFCPKCGTPVSQAGGGVYGRQPWGGQSSQPVSGGLSMQWHQLVTTLGLLGSAVVFLIFAVRTILGSAYLHQTMSLVKKAAKVASAFAGDLASQIAELKEEYSVGEIWDEFGGLKAMDIIMIICWFAMIAAAFVVRQQLVQYRRNAPKYLVIFILAAGGLYFLHSLVRQIVFGGALKTMSMGIVSANFMVVPIIGLIGAVVAAYFNHVYYTKRAALFRN